MSFNCWKIRKMCGFALLSFYPINSIRKISNYFEWNGISNFVIAQSLGFETYHKNILGTIANYENLDNYVHGIHDYQKYIKFLFDCFLVGVTD